MKKLLLTILFLTLFPLYIYAEDTTVSELISTSGEVKAEEIQALDEKEQQRELEIANQLGFVLPPYSDNPSYVITFTDPSPEKNGVEIEIDGKAFTKISSPYTFPALNIGQHALKFRFNDKDGAVKILEYNFIILPRKPIINTPKLEEGSITISGTALSNSEVLYSLTANAFNDKGVAITDDNGDWSVKITPEGGLSEGIYSFMAYTRKYGYASELSDSITFEVGEDLNKVMPEDNSNIFFSFSSLNKDNIVNAFTSNKDLVILLFSFLALGMVLAVIIQSTIYNKRKDKNDIQVEKIIRGEKKEGSEKTLKELFESKIPEKKDLNTPISEPIPVDIPEPISKNETNENIMTKEDFLQKYKSVDPDNESGKEVKPEKIKRIKVSLTTKEE